MLRGCDTSILQQIGSATAARQWVQELPNTKGPRASPRPLHVCWSSCTASARCQDVVRCCARRGAVVRVRTCNIQSPRGRNAPVARASSSAVCQGSSKRRATARIALPRIPRPRSPHTARRSLAADSEVYPCEYGSKHRHPGIHKLLALFRSDRGDYYRSYPLVHASVLRRINAVIARPFPVGPFPPRLPAGIIFSMSPTS